MTAKLSSNGEFPTEQADGVMKAVRGFDSALAKFSDGEMDKAMEALKGVDTDKVPAEWKEPITRGLNYLATLQKRQDAGRQIKPNSAGN
jgi:hypothetical protein